MPLLLGIDIGATKLALGLGDETGRIHQRFRRATEASERPEADVARVAEDARRLLRQAGASRGDVAAVGVSVPGPLDPGRRILLHPPNLPEWQEAPLVELFEAALGGPVYMENDADAAALAEWRFGAGRGCASAIYLTMSTGIGGGLILGGRLYRGPNACAGEIGHIAVEWEGAPCACGLRGCLEAYAGGAAWTERLRRIAPASSRVTALAGGRERAKPEHVVAAARQGDAFALTELDRFNHYLARGISILAFLLAPERVILGTIAVAAGEELCFAPVRERVRSQVWPALGGEMEIVPAALGPELAELAGICAALEGMGEGAGT